MESEIDPKDVCFCLLPWVRLHNTVLLRAASQSRIIKDLADFKLKYEKEKGPKFWESHNEKCPYHISVTLQEKLRNPKPKPKFEGVIGANMVPLIKNPPKSTSKPEKENLSVLRNSKGVVRAAFRLFLSRRTHPEEKISLKDFKERFNLPFDEHVIDEDITAVLGEDCFAEYFPPQRERGEAVSPNQVENVHLEDREEEVDFPVPSPVDIPPRSVCFKSIPLVKDVTHAESFVLAEERREMSTSEVVHSEGRKVNDDEMTMREMRAKLFRDKLFFDVLPLTSNNEPILIADLEDSIESEIERYETNFREVLGRVRGSYTITQKPINNFGNTSINSNFTESLISKPVIPKRVIFGPETAIFHLRGKTLDELYEPDIKTDDIVIPLDWNNYFEN